jgi:hypothetical protein
MFNHYLKFIALLCGIHFGYAVIAQSTQGIPYQAVARTAQGEPYVNASVQVRFSLREQSVIGTISYQESHSLITNDLGLFSTIVGTGASSVSTFSAINWDQTVKFLQVEIDLGQGWVDMGNQQLMSVPYALYAASSGSDLPSDASNGQVLTFCNGSPTWTTGGQCPGVITDLACNSAVNSGTLTAGISASGVSSIISYTGGNGGTYGGQTVNSTGVSGVTASLVAGSFALGGGTLTYSITGTPSSTGTAIFPINIAGQSCSLNLNINPQVGAITNLDCNNSMNNGTLTAGVVASSVSSTISYTGGNGGQFDGQIVPSTGVLGLVANLTAGTLANGNGTIVVAITGTPSTAGTASFALSIGGQACNLTRTIEPLTVGSQLGCGIVAYILQPGDPGYDPAQVHGLIAAPSDQSSWIVWGCATCPGFPNAVSAAYGTGAVNTGYIINQCPIAVGNTTYQFPSSTPNAANVCADLVLNGCSDWHLPSLDELEKIYMNRALIGNLYATYYWSSTQGGNCGLARTVDFAFHNPSSGDVTLPTALVRAVRYF